MSFFPHQLAAPAAVPPSRVVWEETACLLCGRRHWNQVIEAPDTRAGANGLWFAVVQCLECGLCFTNPRPDRHSIGQFYPADYRPHQPRAGQRRPARRPLAWHLPGQPWRTLPWPGPGRLLDFGCGNGSFLERVRRQGWDVTGIDVARVAVQRTRDDGGLRVLAGTLPHPELAAASFDVMTMWHSLEHVHDPLAVLGEAHRLLSPSGKLLVAVPNLDSLPFRWFAQAWVGLDLPRHLTHFTPGTLYRMLRRAGFKVGPVRMVRHSNWLRSSAAVAERLLRRPRWHCWLKAGLPSRLATWYSFLTGRADCLQVIARRR
ncbi:MAG TPA: class I SAM-dependent methyltransferase [Gemmataceae bacterium]|nr:class I SAM-dependent methyltransferase [Gemmataceae bacterium]